MAVYFLRPVGMDGPVKIGCSKCPLDRLDIYMQWAPFPLEVVATLPGDFKLEARFHAMFAASHSHHEWFKASPELTATIRAITDGTFDAGSLPDPKRITGVRPQWSAESRLSASMKIRINALKRRGVDVPEDVSNAAARYGAGRYYHDYNPHLPADAALVQAFLAEHPPTQRRRAT